MNNRSPGANLSSVLRFAIGALLFSCNWVQPLRSCDELSYKTGERYTVTILTVLPQEATAGEACVPLELGDKYDFSIGPDSEAHDGCQRAAVVDEPPAFLADVVDACEPGSDLRFVCSSTNANIAVTVSGNPKASETTSGSLVVQWAVDQVSCRQRYEVELQSLDAPGG